MRIPTHIRAAVKARLWEHADQMEWEALSSVEKSRLYTQWTESEKIGRVLSAYMDPRAVRVYIKDTLLKGYGRQKLNEHQALVLRVMNYSLSNIDGTYVKPHGLRYDDGSIVVWGRADDWKMLLGSLFERSYLEALERATAIFFRSSPRFVTTSSREHVEAAAERLGIQQRIWFD